MNETTGWTLGGIFGFLMICVLVGGGMWGCPQYNIYQKTLDGEAKLKQAEWTRQIQIENAKAKEKSAEMLGKADLIKAKYKSRADSIRAIGTANANRIISNSITPEYVRWLFVDQLDQTQNQVIYIPTEGNIPIMEAGRK